MLNIRYFAPHPKLRHLVNTYYLYDAQLADDLKISDRLITESANLRVFIGGEWTGETRHNGKFAVPRVILCGPNSYPNHVSVTGSFRMFGIGILPLGWSALFGQSAADFADRVVDFADVVGPASRDCAYEAIDTLRDDDMLIDRLEQQLFKILAARQARLSPVVRAVQDLIATHPVNRVDRLGEKVETSPRQLERLIRDSFGFSPKTALRRARVRRTINAMKGYIGRDWESQAEVDFSDQSHLIHEFRRFTGMTPSAYIRQSNPFMDVGHAMQAALHRKLAAPHRPEQRLLVRLQLADIGTPVRLPNAA